jgi:VTC domain
MTRDRACPVAHVRYDREAWISVADNSVRVTMDRNVLIAPEFVTRFTEQLDDPTCVYGRLVVLELKFTGRFPDWFKEMVRIFNLRQGSASKFADGIARKGEHFFHPWEAARPLTTSAAESAKRRDARLSRLDNLLARAA